MTLSFIFLAFQAIIPNTCCIKGCVYDNNNNPVERVEIMTKDTKNTYYSDLKGEFAILSSCSSRDTLILKKDGFEVIEIEVFENKYNRIILQKESIALNEVIIRNPRFGKTRSYAAQTIDFKISEVYTNPTAFGDILAISKFTPGTQSPGNDGKLYVRGGNSDEVGFYIDGMKVTNSYQLTQRNVATRSKYSPSMYKGISSQSGGYESEYGQSLSGITKLYSIDTVESNVMELQMSSTGAGSGYSKGLGKSSTYLNVLYSNMTPYGKIMKDDYKWNRYYNDLSISNISNIKINNKIDLKIIFNASSSSVDYQYEIDKISFRNKLDEKYAWMQATLNYSINKNIKIFAGTNYIRDNFNGTDLKLKYDSLGRVNSNSHSKFVFSINNSMLTYKTGMEINFSDLAQKYKYFDTYDIQLNDILFANYHTLELYPTENLVFSTGTRFEYSNLINKYNIAPRCYIAYNNRENIFSFTAGRYFQTPEINEFETNNIKLDFQKSDVFTLSYSHSRKTNKIQLDLFFKNYSNLITYNKGILYNTDIESNGNGYAYGFDIFSKFNYKLFEYWISYSFIESKRKYLFWDSEKTPDNIAKYSLKFDVKYWVGFAKTLFAAGYFWDSGSFSNLSEKNNTTNMKTPNRNSITISASYLPSKNVILHFTLQNLFGKRNIYGYSYYPVTDNIIANTTPGKRFVYLGLFITLKN